MLRNGNICFESGVRDAANGISVYARPVCTLILVLSFRKRRVCFENAASVSKTMFGPRISRVSSLIVAFNREFQAFTGRRKFSNCSRAFRIADEAKDSIHHAEFPAKKFVFWMFLATLSPCAF
jgi:hypothetical protein